MPDPIPLVLDVETGGLNPRTDALITVGLYCPEATLSYEMWVGDTTGSWGEAAQRVHGIDKTKHFSSMRTLSVNAAAHVVTELLSRAQAECPPDSKLYIAGHNIAFDLRFMRRLFRLACEPLPRLLGPHRTVDTHTLLWAEFVAGRLPYEATSSQGAFDHFGIHRPEPHNALGDCMATHALLKKLVGRA